MAALVRQLPDSSKTIDIPAGLRGQPLDAWSGPESVRRISVRLTGVLRRSGVRVLGDLHGRKVGDFARERNCGLKTLHELDSLARSASRDCGRVENASSARNPCCSRRPVGDAPASHREAATADGVDFGIPDLVSQLQLDELPITTRLANVARSMGAQTLGDLTPKVRHGTSPSDWRTFGVELLQYKDCGSRTVGEIEQLIERALSGEFDVAQIEEHTAVVELLILVEQGIAKLSPRDRQFLLARIDGLTFKEIGQRFGFTRARAHQVVAKALDILRKGWGPRVPRLLDMVKRRCLSIPNASGLTPALLEQWIGESSRSFRLSRKAHVRLIAALDKNIPWCMD
jgi:RNA polymerase sigma factor (sigma-70 family)